jgi:hypothetical protein
MAAFAGFTKPPSSGQANQFVSPQPLDRLIRKEVSLGVVREIVKPEDHIGLSLVPFYNVPTDDFIFDYVKGLTSGLAPAIAEAAESELAQKDSGLSGQGRASLIDWRLKDHYDAADVQRFRDLQIVAENLGPYGLPNTLQGDANDLPQRISNDTAERRRRLDNRIEWMIMESLSTGVLGYNDGNIKFLVDWKRPADQQAQAPGSGSYAGNAFDPIKDINDIKRKIYNRTGVKITRAIVSNRYLNTLINSDKFLLRSGFPPGSNLTQSDLPYLLNGWGPQAAIDEVARQTGVTFIEYDSGYRTKPDLAAGPVTFNRFLPENRVIFLPDEAQISQFDSSPLGFGKVATSPHSMGNGAPGFYEWEQETTDPWGRNIGTGIKCFPIFPHMELSYTMDVELPPEV